MAKFSELVSYFENLARKHKSILHTDEEKHFFRFEIDEVLAGLNRTDVNYKMLILEGYGFGYQDNKSDNLIKDRSGAFILLDQLSDKTDYKKMHETWDELEEIGDDIIAKIKADKKDKDTPAVRDFGFESVNGSLLMNELGSNIGIRFTFTIGSPTSNDVDSDKWLS